MSNQSFRQQRRRDVITFLEIIGKLAINYSSIDFKDNLKSDYWGYKVSDIRFMVEKSTLKHVWPQGFTDLEVVIEVEVESKISDWSRLNDPFSSLNFRSLIRGSNSITSKMHHLGFHIDRHDSSKIANEIHPLYHLQYVQNSKVKDKSDFDHGETLQLDVPRMMHLPMDLILGVSTLLSNFAPNKYTQLIDDKQFVNLCKEYQERVWRPYFNSLENHWLKNPVLWDAKLNCPYLL